MPQDLSFQKTCNCKIKLDKKAMIPFHRVFNNFQYRNFLLLERHSDTHVNLTLIYRVDCEGGHMCLNAVCLSGSEFYNEKFGHCSQRKTLAGQTLRDACDGWEIRNLTISDFHHSVCLCCVEKIKSSVAETGDGWDCRF